MKRTEDVGDRSLLIAISIVVFVDTMLYSVLAPLLPTLAHALHLSKLSAGVMTASYPLGTLLGSLPAGVLVVRAGPRFTVAAGLTLLALSTVAFGWLDNVAALDIARFAEGVGGACSWSGGLAWIVAGAPQDQRGGLMGKALGAAIGGALLGPVIGSIATAIGRPAAFTVLAVGVALLLAWASRRPSRHEASSQGMRAVLRVMGRGDVRAAMWLMALPAVASGTINVLGPLRLHERGVAAAGVGATFLIAAGLEASLAPVIGTLSDRRGRMFPLRCGLGATTVSLLCFTLPAGALGLAAVIALIAVTLSLFWAPAMAMLSDLAGEQGLDQGLAAAMMNLAWAGGQIVGSGGGGALAKATADGAATGAIAAACALTLATLLLAPAVRQRLTASPSA